MGYAMCTSPCGVCDRMFMYNPVRVPSARDKNGVKQPICYDCVQWANPQREAKGLPAIVPHPDAYGPCDEEELW